MTPSFCQDLSLLTYGPGQGAAALLRAAVGINNNAKMLHESTALTPRESKNHPASTVPSAEGDTTLVPEDIFVSSPTLSLGHLTHLTVQTQHHQHGEEEDRPEWGQGQLCDNLRVGEESQPRACSNEKKDEPEFTKHLMGSLS